MFYISNESYNKKLLSFALVFLTCSIFLLFIIIPDIRNYILKVISPIMVAFSIAYLMDPLVRFIVRKTGLSRGKSIILTILSLILIIVVLGAIAIPSLISSLSTLDNVITENAGSFMKYVDSFLSSNNIDNNGIETIITYIANSLDSITKQISVFLTTSLEKVLTSLLGFTSSVAGFLMSFVIAIYMLFSKEDLLKRVKRMNYAFLSKEAADYNYKIVNDSNKVFSGFLIGKLIDSLIIGVLCWVLAMIFRIPNSLVIGFIVGITNMIPYFGPIIGAVPCFIITLIFAPGKSLILIVLILVIQQLDGLVIGPKILGDTVGVDAFWIITAVTVGGASFGVLGMLLGVPVFVVIKNIIEEKVQINLDRKGIKDV